MLKPISAMTDHEMLVELLQAKRRGEFWSNVKLVAAGVILAILIFLGIRYLPPVIRYFQRLGDGVETIKNSMIQVQEVTDSLKDSVTGLLEKLANLLRWGSSGSAM